MSSENRKIHGFEVETQESDRIDAERYEPVKLILDFLLAVVLLVVLSPVILLSLILVRMTSRGAAIYTQRRVGRDGKPFTILKIRSMYLDSEIDGATWCVPGDRRITPIGRFLRWSHMDELPQLINVIRGEMSLIGPRPERPEIIAKIEYSLPHYRQRLAVRPGLTGLAQVLQPPDTDLASVRRKLNYDLYYVDRMNLWLDLRISIGTALLLVLPSNVIASLMGFPDEALHLRAEPVA
jgi:lipopolysaccharide/colanic/teichoic acid biosynthesis glycosyltransferase